MEWLTDLRKTARLSAIANAIYMALLPYTLWTAFNGQAGASIALIHRISTAVLVVVVSLVAILVLAGVAVVFAFYVYLSTDTFVLQISRRLRYIAFAAAAIYIGNVALYLLGAFGVGIYRTSPAVVFRILGALVSAAQAIFLVALARSRVADDAVPSRHTGKLKKLAFANVMIALLALLRTSKQLNPWDLLWEFLLKVAFVVPFFVVNNSLVASQTSPAVQRLFEPDTENAGSDGRES